MRNAVRVILAILLAFYYLPMEAVGQQVTTTTFAQTQDQRTLLATQSGNATVIFDVRPGITSHQVTFVVGPSVSAITTTVTGSATGQNGSFSSCGSSTSLGATITCTGTFNAIKVAYTGFTGSGSIDATYFGESSVAGAGQIAPVAVMETSGTAITIYASTLSTIATNLTTTSGNPITTSTITVNMMRCHNETSSAVTVNRTDTAGNAFETSFSIPANSNYYLESPGSMTKMVGLKLWAGTANALNCVMDARQ